MPNGFALPPPLTRAPTIAAAWSEWQTRCGMATGAVANVRVDGPSNRLAWVWPASADLSSEVRGCAWCVGGAFSASVLPQCCLTGRAASAL